MTCWEMATLIDGRFTFVYNSIEIPHEGPIADLMWSDPDPTKQAFGVSPRGAGFTFGKEVVDMFLHRNGMSHILRAHQLCMEGM